MSPLRLTSPQVRDGVIQLLVVGAIAARFAVLFTSVGTNDILSWYRFAASVRDHGLLETYLRDPLFNHSPLMGYYAAAVLGASEWSGLPFPIAFKLLPVVADVAAGSLVWRACRPLGDGTARAAAAAYLCSPVAFLISAHHGNTDSILATLLLGAALLADRQAPLAAGLALGAAVNVKIVALLVGPAILLQQRDRRAALRFLAGCGAGAVPFVPLLLAIAPTFWRNAVGHNSNLDHWGIPFFLTQLQASSPVADAAAWAAGAYRVAGRYVVLAVGLGAAIMGRLRGWTALRTLAVAYAGFLLVAPGFGVQYLVWLLPLLCATSPRHGLAFSATAGAFLFLTYLHFWNRELPAATIFYSRFPLGASLFGLLAWAGLVAFLRFAVAEPPRA